MKLLICTQVVDQTHPILGFFHRWLEEFSKYCEEIHVVCLYEGEHHLPPNVHVHSLGKNEGKGRFTYITRFYRYIWKYRHDYDSVFVHMNEEYVLMGAPFWKLTGKKIGHWYMHKVVKWTLHVSEKLVDVIFSGSKESFRLSSKKLHITGHGIDTVRFSLLHIPKEYDLLTVGRITPSKNLEALINLLEEVRKEESVALTVIGSLEMSGDQEYLRELRALIAQKSLTEYVHFLGAIPNHELPTHIARARVFVQAATNGSLDKALLEPLAMEVPLVTTAEGANSLPLGDWRVNDKNSFVKAVIQILQTDTSEKSNTLRQYVIETHSLTSLIPYILKEYRRSEEPLNK